MSFMSMIRLRRCLFSSIFICLSVTLLCCSSVDAKPANNVFSAVISNPSTAASPDSSAKTFRASQPIYTGRSLETRTQGRKVLTSWNEDGSWQASARLPTANQSGGNDHSRYKIRRDGSLSLALQIPKSKNLFEIINNPYRRRQGSLPKNYGTAPFARGTKVDHVGRNGKAHGINNSKSFSPAELRSFSVVISDVDVTGNYNDAQKDNHPVEEDAYSKAGIASYHLKSNSIHRMNASWKLKPGHGSPTSSDLLEFLTHFANGGDGRATRSEVEHDNGNRDKTSENKKFGLPPLRKILGQQQEVGDHGVSRDNDESEDSAMSKQPFLTWSETSRNVPLSSSTELIDTHVRASTFGGDNGSRVNDEQTLPEDSDTNATSTDAIKTELKSSTASDTQNVGGEAKVMLHELFSTLARLNQNIEEDGKPRNGERNSSVVDNINTTTEDELSADQIKNIATSTLPAEVTDYGDETSEYSATESLSPTEVDQVNTEAEQQQVDVEMTESLPNKNEKEGDVFVEDDEAKSLLNYNTTHNQSLTASAKNFSSTPTNPTTNDAVAVLNEQTKKKRSAKSALFYSSAKSTNNEDNNNATSSSATSFLEPRHNANSRMKITDPQQTASDLKKLMSLILKSDGNRNGGGVADSGGDGKSGTHVVNIVITPNQDSLTPSPPTPLPLHLSASHLLSPMKNNNRQKIVFLKTPQVKQMLDVALNDPAVSSAAQKIAAALETNPFPNPLPPNIDIDHTYGHPSGYFNHQDNAYIDSTDSIHKIGNINDNSPTAPEGFPLSGSAYMNLHHPNLQFHQALHHMVANGTVPTSINATTKTNIINIFVINFKENSNKAAATSVTQHAPSPPLSPFRIKIKPSPKPSNLPFPITITPIIGETDSSTIRPTPSYLYTFSKKMGIAAEDDEKEDVGGGLSPEKNDRPKTNVSTSNSDKINIFDLLPGDIGTVTAVQYAPGVGTEPNKSSFTQTMLGENNAYNSTYYYNDNANTMGQSAIVPYRDYFADFLPDRSRDPPENIKPPGSESINEDDILSILTSRKPTAPPGLSSSGFMSTGGEDDDEISLPPSLAHLEWIFKNEPPPKPLISSDDFSKRKGEGQSSDEDGTDGGDSDSMMEPEETSNSPLSSFHGGSPQDLVEFLLKLQNVSRPMTLAESNNLFDDDFSAVYINSDNVTNNGTSQENERKPLNTHHHSHHGHNQASTTVIEYTTKKPPFWKFSNKLPLGSLSSNNEVTLNNRLRKFMTAFGYSALPTLAAGAAATWPYWVPLVATGRRRKRRSTFKHEMDPLNSDEENFHEVIKTRGHDFLTSLLMTDNNENGTSSSFENSSLGPSNRQVLSKSTKNSRLEGNASEKKWIKVDVITTANPFPASSSSPTLSTHLHGLHHDYDKKKENGTSFHGLAHDNNLFLGNTKNNNSHALGYVNNLQHRNGNDDTGSAYSPQHTHKLQKNQDDGSNGHHQLDLPLLKNFLKNVLYNELNLSTRAPNPLQSSQKLHRQRPLLTTFISSTLSPPIEPMVLSQLPIFTPTNMNLKKIITKNDHESVPSSTSNIAPYNDNDNNAKHKNNLLALLNSPSLNRPSSSPSFPSLLIPEYSLNKNKDYVHGGGTDEQVITSSKKKVVTVSTFTTPSTASVYIHNRGDGSSSVTTQLPSPASVSLVHWQHDNNHPWGASFTGSGDRATTMRPDKITGRPVTTTFTNTAVSSSLSNGHLPGIDNNGPSSATFSTHQQDHHLDYFANHFHQADKRREKLKLANSIKASEDSYKSAALFPLWFPILFSHHKQFSAKLKEAIAAKRRDHYKYS